LVLLPGNNTDGAGCQGNERTEPSAWRANGLGLLLRKYEDLARSLENKRTRPAAVWNVIDGAYCLESKMTGLAWKGKRLGLMPGK
jgi:hypothetical protein